MCNHLSKIGDNYGESCADCGEQLSGYGHGGWFGKNLTGKPQCIHLPSKLPDSEYSICIYCEQWFEDKEIGGKDHAS